jgi:hypothetical protein
MRVPTHSWRFVVTVLVALWMATMPTASFAAQETKWG